MNAAARGVSSILAALDGPEHAAPVFAAAARMARGLGARLYLVRVLIMPPEIPPAADVPPDTLERSLADEARAQLQALMDGEPGIRFGPPIVLPDRDVLVVHTPPRSHPAG